MGKFEQDKNLSMQLDYRQNAVRYREIILESIKNHGRITHRELLHELQSQNPTAINLALQDLALAQKIEVLSPTRKTGLLNGDLYKFI